MVSFAIPAAVVFSVHNCVMVCGCPIYSNVFLRIMASLTITKHPPVSSSTAEAATNFKIFKFMCMGPFKRSRVHFEFMLPKKNILQCNYTLPVQLDMMHWHLRINSCPKCGL